MLKLILIFVLININNIVKVRINYPDKSRRKEAIKRAKECVVSTSILGSVGCKSKSAKLNNNGK
jgi:hypothetical protein